MRDCERIKWRAARARNSHMTSDSTRRTVEENKRGVVPETTKTATKHLYQAVCIASGTHQFGLPKLVLDARKKRPEAGKSTRATSAQRLER